MAAGRAGHRRQRAGPRRRPPPGGAAAGTVLHDHARVGRRRLRRAAGRLGRGRAGPDRHHRQAHRPAQRVRRASPPVGRGTSFGWLNRHRRLVRDYERRPEHHEASRRRSGVWAGGCGSRAGVPDRVGWVSVHWPGGWSSRGCSERRGEPGPGSAGPAERVSRVPPASCCSCSPPLSPVATPRTPPRQRAHPGDIVNINRQSDARFAALSVTIANVAIACTRASGNTQPST